MTERINHLVAVAALAALAATALAAVLTLQFTANDAEAQDRSLDEGQVRVAARVLDRGGVEVAVQSQFDGDWSERILPERRILSAAAPTGKWFVSSPVALPVEEPRTACLVTHGRSDDSFWRSLLGAAQRMSAGLSFELQIEQHPDPDDQAAAVRACAAAGVAAIASTLAAPEVVGPALLEASNAGVQIFTFNSGADHAVAARSLAHVALDEREAGRLAGQTFNELEVVGVALCVLHEQQNVGLTERCDGLAETYTGEVELLQLDESLLAAGRTAAIAARLSTGGVGGLLALNPDTAIAGLRAIHETGSSALLGSVGISAPQFRQLEPELLASFAFALGDGAQFQAIYTMAAIFNRIEPGVIVERLIPTAPPLTYIAPGLLRDYGAAIQARGSRLQRGP